MTATLRLHLEGPEGAIDFDTFVRAMERTLLVLRDVDQVLSARRRGVVRWKVASLGTASIDAVLRGEPKQVRYEDVVPRVAAGSVEALRVAELGEMLPPYLSDTGLTQLEKLAGGLGQDGATGLDVTYVEEEASAHVRHNVRDQVRRLRVPATEAIGSVTGTLEEISVHRRPRFSVYDAVTRRAVTAAFEPSDVGLVKEALGERVNVSGVVRRNGKGQPLRVERARLTILPGADQLPTVSDLIGIDPDFTGDESTDEFLRHLRDG